MSLIFDLLSLFIGNEGESHTSLAETLTGE